MTKDKTITYSVEEQLKAKAFCESINGNALAFMVKHMLSEHFQEFQPYLIKLGGENK